MTSYLRRVAVVLFLDLTFVGCGGANDAAQEPAGNTAAVQPTGTPSSDAAAKQATIDAWAEEKDSRRRMLQLLAPRRELAEIMTLSVPADISVIAAKLKAAAQRNPADAAEIFKNTGPDGVAKYDARMGVTRQEYERFLKGRSEWTLVKTADVPIVIEPPAGDAVRITGLPQLDSLAFDAAKLSVTTPYGSLELGKLFEPNDGQNLTGRIAGFRCAVLPSARFCSTS
ncbi:MAG: hypothetical protein QM775_07310 [Pirellulales bacterium]